MRTIFSLVAVLAAMLLAATFGMAADAEKAPADKAAAEKAPAEKAATEKGAEKAPAAEKLSEDGFVPIFNGKDLTGWDGKPSMWSVKDGCIRGEATKNNMQTGGNTFLTWQGGKPADFELRLSCKMVGGNSGIQYRSFTRPEQWVVGGYQMEVSTDPKNAGFLYGELFRGGMARVGQKVVWKGGAQVVGSLGDAAEIAKSYKKDDWNDYRIVCRGNHIEQYLNGIQTIDLVDEDPKAPSSGVIALQIHQGYVMVVEFKDIRLKKFEKEGAAKTDAAKPDAKKPDAPKAEAPKSAQ
jgi:hypothetical protein